MRLEALDTDVTALAVDAIANAANTQLMHGGGVAAAIARAGGAAVDAESREAARIEVETSRAHDAGSLEHVVFACHGKEARAAFAAAIDATEGSRPWAG